MSPSDPKSVDPPDDLVRLVDDVSKRLSKTVPKIVIRLNSPEVISVEQSGGKLIVSQRAIECLSADEMRFAVGSAVGKASIREWLAYASLNLLVCSVFALALLNSSRASYADPNRALLVVAVILAAIIGTRALSFARERSEDRRAMQSGLAVCPDLSAARSATRKEWVDVFTRGGSEPRLSRDQEKRIDANLIQLDRIAGELGVAALATGGPDEELRSTL